MYIAAGCSSRCSQISGAPECARELNRWRKTKDVQYARLCRGSRHRSHTSICPCTLSVPDRPLFPSNGTDAHWCFPNKQSIVPNITTVQPECQVSSYAVPSVSLAEPKNIGNLSHHCTNKDRNQQLRTCLHRVLLACQSRNSPARDSVVNIQP